MKEHKRIIVKFKKEAEYYNSQSSTIPLKKNNRRVLTMVTNDDCIVVANKNIKATIYADGKILVEHHDNTKSLKPCE